MFIGGNGFHFCTSIVLMSYEYVYSCVFVAMVAAPFLHMHIIHCCYVLVAIVLIPAHVPTHLSCIHSLTIIYVPF